MKISAVIPMAGESSRFFAQGYEVPKYKLEVSNNTLFEWSIESLPLGIIDKFVFIYLEDHQKKWRTKNFIEDKVKKYSFDYELVSLDKKTEGQAETVLKSEEVVNGDDDLLIYNIDTYFCSDSLVGKLMDSELKGDGLLGAFRVGDDSNKWSFAKISEKGRVLQTAEKDSISDFGLTGLYHFTHASDFFEIGKEQVKSGEKSKGEYYIAPMYNKLINRDKKFYIDVCEKFIPLGTPESYEKAISNSFLSKMRGL